LSPEKIGGQTRDISDDPIALDGNNLASRFGRSHYANLAFEFFDKQAGAQFVITHVGGENDRTVRGSQLVQKIFSLEFVSRRRSQESEDGGVSGSRRNCRTCETSADSHERRRTRQNNGELEADCFARRPGQKEETSVSAFRQWRFKSGTVSTVRIPIEFKP